MMATKKKADLKNLIRNTTESLHLVHCSLDFIAEAVFKFADEGIPIDETHGLCYLLEMVRKEVETAENSAEDIELDFQRGEGEESSQLGVN
jgi:hypothetical protein